MRKQSGQVHSRESSATLQLTVSLLYPQDEVVKYLQEAPSFVNVANVCFVTFIIQHQESRCLSFMQNHELAHL